MSESPVWQLPLSPSVFAGLIHAYDHRVPDDSLRMERPDPPFAAWLVRQGSVTVTFKGGTKSDRTVTARKNEWLLLPARPRVHQMDPGTHLLSVRMNLERAHGTALFSVMQPFRLSKFKVSILPRSLIGLFDVLLNHTVRIFL